MDKVVVEMEPTGHYWFNLAHILKENEIKFVAVNPLHVKKLAWLLQPHPPHERGLSILYPSYTDD